MVPQNLLNALKHIHTINNEVVMLYVLCISCTVCFLFKYEKHEKLHIIMLTSLAKHYVIEYLQFI